MRRLVLELVTADDKAGRASAYIVANGAPVSVNCFSAEEFVEEVAQLKRELDDVAADAEKYFENVNRGKGPMQQPGHFPNRGGREIDRFSGDSGGSE